LLDGLEAVELRLSEVLKDNASFRFDSEHFKKEYLRNIKNIENYRYGYILFSSIIKKLTGGATPLGANYFNEGIPFIRVQNIMQNYFDLNDVVYISTANDEDIKRSRLKIDDVLLTITGVSYGKSAVVNKEIVNSNINQHSVKIEINNDFLPLFISTFLNSRVGKLQSDKNIIGISRPALDYSSIRKFKIPKVSINCQFQIVSLVKLAYQRQQLSEKDYEQAKNLLLTELNLLNFKASTENIAIKSFSESFGGSGRLDSEYYQPKYDEVEEKILATHELGTLKDFLTVNQRGTQPNYAEYGLPVINSKYVQEGEVLLTDNRLATVPDKDDALFIQKDDVLINGTGVGTIGRSAPYLHNENAIPDNHVTILRTKNLNPIFLSVYLNSIAGKYQVDKYFKGSSGQIELYPKDIANFYIPLVSDEIQQTIAEKIKASFKLKAESKRLLKLAKKAVEIAIEQNEEVALEYINTQTKELNHA